MTRHHVRQLASEFMARGDATGWFEALYSGAGSNYADVPWADLKPNTHLVSWSQHQAITGHGKTALVVGCGYGDDAEFLAQLGFRVVAFDVAPTAIAQCQTRFPQSPVAYQVANLLNPPTEWLQGFDFVLESYTLQALPHELRSLAISQLSSLVARSGQLLIISRGREATDPPGELPYPLTKAELDRLEDLGFQQQSFEDYFDDECPPVRRFRILYSHNGLANIV